jgi:hypothetical protein
MTETLLSLSNVLLYGLRVTDLTIGDPTANLVEVDAATRKNNNISPLSGQPKKVDGVKLTTGETVLVKNQNTKSENGVYTVAGGAWTPAAMPAIGTAYRVMGGNQNGGSIWALAAIENGNEQVYERVGRGGRRLLGQNALLESQLEDACFARIYGFSYEGIYYDLPTPTLFLVHGDGEVVTLSSRVVAVAGGGGSSTDANLARAPRKPSVMGVAAADFEFADDVRVWSYDKADFTIRLDVETGMFEDILLGPFFEGGGGGVSGARVSGARLSGARVSGARVSGARVSGARVSGARVSGARLSGDASD